MMSSRHEEDATRKNSYRDRARQLVQPIGGSVQSWAPVNETEGGAFVECQVWLPEQSDTMKQVGRSLGGNSFALCRCGLVVGGDTWAQVEERMDEHQQSGQCLSVPLTRGMGL